MQINYSPRHSCIQVIGSSNIYASIQEKFYARQPPGGYRRGTCAGWMAGSCDPSWFDLVNALRAVPASFELLGSALCVDSVPALTAHNLGLGIALPGGEEATVLPVPAIDVHSVRSCVRRVSPPPTDLRRIRETDPRRILGDVYNALLRRLR